MGRASDAHSERMSASLAHLAKEHGLERIDHVMLSNQTPRAAAAATVFVVQGEPSNPAHLRASMPTDVAVTTPVEQSLAKLQELDARTLAQAQSLAQERSMAQGRRSSREVLDEVVRFHCLTVDQGSGFAFENAHLQKSVARQIFHIPEYGTRLAWLWN